MNCGSTTAAAFGPPGGGAPIVAGGAEGWPVPLASKHPPIPIAAMTTKMMRNPAACPRALMSKLARLTQGLMTGHKPFRVTSPGPAFDGGAAGGVGKLSQLGRLAACGAGLDG